MQNEEDSIYFNKVFVEPNEDGEGQPPVPEPPVDEELKDIETKYKTLKVTATKFLKSEEWSDTIKNLL